MVSRWKNWSEMEREQFPTSSQARRWGSFVFKSIVRKLWVSKWGMGGSSLQPGGHWIPPSSSRWDAPWKATHDFHVHVCRAVAKLATAKPPEVGDATLPSHDIYFMMGSLCLWFWFLFFQGFGRLFSNKFIWNWICLIQFCSKHRASPADIRRFLTTVCFLADLIPF